MFLTFRFMPLNLSDRQRRLCFGFACASCCWTCGGWQLGSSVVGGGRVPGTCTSMTKGAVNTTTCVVDLCVFSVLSLWKVFLFPGQTREQQCPTKASSSPTMHHLCGSSEPVVLYHVCFFWRFSVELKVLYLQPSFNFLLLINITGSFSAGLFKKKISAFFLLGDSSAPARQMEQDVRFRSNKIHVIFSR